MSALTEAAITLAKETVYGTPVVTGDRVFEGKSDSWKRQHQVLDSVGMRPNMQAKRSDRRTIINMGGGADLEFDVMNKGFGLVLQSFLGTVSGPVLVGPVLAFESTHQTALDDPDDSWTVQTRRVSMDGTFRHFTHHGSVVTGWSLTQGLDGHLVAKASYDCEDIETASAAATYAEVASMTPFNWTNMIATLNSVASDVTEFSLGGELGLKTDRRFLRGTHLKKRPKRATVPSFSGKVSMEYEDNTQYDDFVAGAIIPIVATWTGALIEAGHNYELEITLAACQYTGDSPQANIDGVPTVELPFDVLHDGTNPAVSITYKSTDTVL